MFKIDIFVTLAFLYVIAGEGLPVIIYEEEGY